MTSTSGPHGPYVSDTLHLDQTKDALEAQIDGESASYVEWLRSPGRRDPGDYAQVVNAYRDVLAGGTYEMEIDIAAPRERVWKTCTDPELIPEWWGDGTVVEWLVKMRRLPAQQMLDYAIRHGSVTREDVRRFALALASFYRGAEPVTLDAGQYRQRLERDARKEVERSRRDLVAALLQPPPPFAPGGFVPDDVLLPRIWPGRAMTRVDLNVLIHRTRHDLVRAEIDGATLLDRARGGSATRFRLAVDARVSVA